MSPEAQRIAIAEADGSGVFICAINDAPFKSWLRRNDECDGFLSLEEPPDYLNDQNAIHKAVETIKHDDELSAEYSGHLHKIVNACSWGTFEVIEATAAQRAEAFLRTLGKWEDA